MEKDTYRTINAPTPEVIYKEKNSKFIGYAFPVENENQVKELLEQVKKEHNTARHWCYAFQVGTSDVYHRTNDDGEPSNTAGAPIYGQIQSFDLTNILVIVVRYFGGVKLGVGGLIVAYRETAKMALEEADIEEKTINKHYIIKFDYKNMNRVMRVIKEKNIDVVNQKLELDCEIEISVRKKNAETIFDIFDTMYEIKIKEKEN
ncbi:YigZ family protein [Flavobacterium agricola]|uniref:YigZ family protein n=1 Tax=Flavobacterium agricola TaxID=2870839 RepID=A0ABY6M147_9FLAO|nr:YigZ family protein [Flavobacterium agricola]UYW01440.1 YigZ family protein [Flavobacterium agricola]